MHPKVNREDPWALASSKPHGSCARDERSKKFWGFGECGMRGELWEPIVEPQSAEENDIL